MWKLLSTPVSQLPYSLQCQISIVKPTLIATSSHGSECAEQNPCIFCIFGQDINSALGNKTAGGTGTGSCQPAPNSTSNASATHLAPVEPAVAVSKQQKLNSDSSEDDRHNFALSKDGAKIVASNKEAKKASAILDTDSDTFMKNECKAAKWFIIELSQVAKVDSFQLSQYELYSSRVKDFEVRGRQAHPRAQGGEYSKSLNTSGWQLMGKYTAAKMKGSQTFTVAEPAWLKYLQFHFLTHHGSEPMCALNDVLVFGKSAAEDLEDQLSDEALLTDAHDSADAKASEAAAPISVNGNADSQAAQARIPSSAQPVAIEAKVDASSSAGLQNPSGALPAGDVSATGEQAPAQQQAPSNSTAGPRQSGQQDSEQRAAASDKMSHSVLSDSVDPTADKVHSVELENEAVLREAPPGAAETEFKAEMRAEASTEDLLLPHNSAGSTKARHGGSIYDMLVQEIKSLKLQQKQTPRQLAELQRNLSMHMQRTAAELGALDQTIKGLQADMNIMQRVKSDLPEDSNTAVATLSDVDVDLRAVLLQLESMQRALHQKGSVMFDAFV
ncbi:MAG: Galactose-binding isoform 1 [Trebouxia sp. A1-2]|nr:MAG: Galactose-binding isoform 1 [Trebouxia sp. A1-2]